MTGRVSITTVEDMLTRNHKGLVFSTDDIGQWCGECIEEIGAYEACEKHEDVKFTTDSKGNIGLPCGIVRVLSITNGLGTPKYTVQKPYVFFKHYRGDVFMSYISIPVDEQGYPYIDAAARQACYWYCYIKLKRNEYEMGKIAPIVWRDYTDNYEYYCDVARGTMRNMSRDEMNEIMSIMYNLIKQPHLPKNIR